MDLSPEIATSSIDWTQMSRFSPEDGDSPISETLNKPKENRRTDNFKNTVIVLYLLLLSSTK
jgi:hypothetical protein